MTGVLSSIHYKKVQQKEKCGVKIDDKLLEIILLLRDVKFRTVPNIRYKWAIFTTVISFVLFRPYFNVTWLVILSKRHAASLI